MSAEVHKLYCAQYLKDHGAPYWSGGDYSKLDERVKEYDRNIVRWHLKLLSEKDDELSKILGTQEQAFYDAGLAAGVEAERARCVKAEGHLFEETILGDGYIGASDREWEKIKQFLSVYHLRLCSLLSPNQTTE